MTKKEYLIKLLTALDGKWPMAAGLKLLIEHNTLDDQTIDALQHIFVEAIKNFNNQKAKASLIKSQEFLQRLREKEIKDNENNKDLDQLLADI